MEKYNLDMEKCYECNIPIGDTVKLYSEKKYEFPLCIRCQNWIKSIRKHTTVETIRLYFALKLRGVPAELEKFDGYKHIDIAVPTAKLNIEVDGLQHNSDTKQALSDLERTYYSFLKGFYTMRIPNSLVNNEDILNKTADYLVKILNFKNQRGY